MAFDTVEETPQGGLAIPAYLTRTGIFEYEQPNGEVIREYRPPEEVFSADSLATLANAPLANDHPPVPIEPINFRKYAVGHVENGSVKQDGDKVSARVLAQEKRTLEDILSKRKRELSCGYSCDVDETPGVIADSGERYDRIQRKIRYNHVALVEDGRAGPTVRLRLDSKGNQLGAEEMADKEFEVIGGVRHEVGTPAHADARKRQDAARADRKDKITKLQADRDKQQARADALEADLKKSQEALKLAQSPQRLDHAVKVRAAVIKRACVALGKEFKADGLSIHAIKVSAVRKHFPAIKLDGKGKDYLNALFRAIPKADVRSDGKQATGLVRLDGENRVSGVPADLRNPPPDFVAPEGRQDGRTMAQIRSDRDEETRHRRPLAVSKSNPHREMDGFPTVQGSQLETMK